MSTAMPFGKRLAPGEQSLADRLAQANHKEPATAAAKPAATEDEESLKLLKTESFQPRAPRYRLSDVILPAATRRQFHVLLARIRNHDLLYKDWELSQIDPRGNHIVVNFYGPPGSGKTMLCEALAAEVNRQIIEVDYADIESKYVGETPKLIRAAFLKAQETGALLLFDEADSILGKRMTKVEQGAEHAVNVSRAVMLKQMDSFSGYLAFATNLFSNFDGAFIRRIAQHIEVPPPEREARLAIWSKMVSHRVPGRQEVDWSRVAEESSGLTGGDIKNAVINALSAVAVREGGERVLRVDDLLIAVADVRRAKEENQKGSGHLEPEVK